MVQQLQNDIEQFNVHVRAIPLKKKGGGRKWPFCPRGSNHPVRGGFFFQFFVLRESKEKVSEGGNIFEKMSEGGKIVKINCPRG